MTPEQLDAIQARITDCQTYKFGMFNADKLAHEDAPDLLAYARDLEARLGRARELHYPTEGIMGMESCAVCFDADENPEAWPCPTSAALTAPDAP